MTQLLPPDRVRALCAKMGITTRKSSRAELDQILHFKPNGIFRSKAPKNAIHMCDCGQVAKFYYGGWECERCRRLRLQWGEESFRINIHDTAAAGALDTVGYEMAFR